MPIPKPWECVRCGRPIPGRSANSPPGQTLGPKATDPFCSEKCLLESRAEYEADRKAKGLPPGEYTKR